ncbi:MAG: protein translocase subunit SecD [Actinobacteria bacterium]|nr:protein translocase subunit SecD [Actinomycetota bacterium]
MSDRAKYLILIGAILAAVVGAALLATPGSPIYRKPALGLDLQGGLEVILKAVPPKGQTVDASGMTTAQSIILSRIDKLGVSSPNVRKQGNDEIVVQLAGVHDPAKAAAIIGKTAQLQLFDFEADVTGPSVDSSGNPIATPTLYDLLTQVQKQAGTGSPQAYYLFRTKTIPAKIKGGKPTVKHSIVQGPTNTQTELLRPYRGKAPPNTQILKVPAHTEVVSCAATTGCLGIQSTTATSSTYYYLLKYFPTRTTGAGPIPEMTGTDLVRGGTNADFGTGGEPIVTLQFTGKGAREFGKITKAEAQRGQTKFDLAGKQGNYLNYAQHFAIVLDGQVESTPYIDFQQNPDGIAGSNAEIDLNGAPFSQAKDLALVLQTGSLPYNFVQIERTDVSATLGKSSLTQAWHAAIVGLLIVALLMLILYRFLGLVAVLGLAIYAALYYAAILLFNVTLTLPGFAGLILTIGVAADANVVVFERIKEEVRSGKSVRAAIATGYRRGFHTILDANVVTAITALVLFLIAVADVKGFALTLLIGTLISLLTAVAATRAMLGLLSGFKWFNNPRFMGAKAETIPRWQQIDVNSRGRRRIFLAIATVAIVASIFALVFKGLNLGIDFRGGTQMSFATKTAQPTSTVQKVFSANGFTDAVVQGRGKQSGNDFEQFQVRTKHLSNAQESTIVNDLTQQANLTGTPDVNTVSSSFSSQIAHDAILAIIVSFLLIAIFIALRFQWRFAIPILRTLFNDILITLGVYALSGREVTIDTVAAVLTVLGYSIYDTIIVFDRIRENMPLMRKASFPTIANISVAETLRRSITTSTLTLLPIASLYIFGGSTLKDFAFALLVGIGLGAVSTIFVATPFLTVLMEGSPEFKRRSTDGADGGFAGTAVPRQLLHALGRHTTATETAAESDGEPEPELVEVAPPAPVSASEQARRERRKQRRRARPHGRAR